MEKGESEREARREREIERERERYGTQRGEVWRDVQGLLSTKRPFAVFSSISRHLEM